MENYNVYIRVDDSGRVVGINSSAFLEDCAGWVQIDSGSGDRYHHAQGNYMPRPIYNRSGIPIYKMEMGEIKERSEDEIRADIKAPEKTGIEKRIETIEKTVKAISDLIAKLGMK